MECPACDGEGCEECDDGQYKVIGCPNAYCREVIPAVNMVDLFEKGLPPIAGGVLDQAAWFIDCVRVFANEESLARAEDVNIG